MQLTALGGAAEVGASCMLLQTGGKNILLDAGIRVNRTGEASLPDLNKLEEIADDLELVLVSHAHMDHSGALPLILERYPTAPIFSTYPTKQIASILLNDAVKIMTREAEEGETEAPLYNSEMVERLLWVMRGVEESVWHKFDDIEVCFHPCGHVLGASCILLKTLEGNVVYSGDISTANQRTVDGMTEIDFFKPDSLILESTYGDGLHPSRKIEEKRLVFSIAEVIDRGGTVLIPSFALGRAQEIILILKSYMLSGVIPQFPIYVDGLVRNVCDLYVDLTDYLSVKLQNFVGSSGGEVFWSQSPQVVRLANDERILMFSAEPKCIVSSSGMMTGGPSVYYAKVLAPGEKNAIFLTGYQDEESPGRQLQELETGDVLELDGEEIPVKCEVNKYNLSAHADQGQLCQQVSYMEPKTIALVHGKWEAIQTLREKLVLKHLVHIPLKNEPVNILEAPEWLDDYTKQKIAGERNTFYGKIEMDDDEVVIRFEPEMSSSFQWKQFFKQYQTVKSKFMGKWIHIRGIAQLDCGITNAECGLKEQK